MTERTHRVLVTGCSSGFGRLTVQALLEHGYAVIAGLRAPDGKDARTAAALAESARASGSRLDTVELDVTSDESVERAVELATRDGSSIDVAVNNAGISAMGVNEGFTPEQARALFEVNVLGAQRVNRAVLPLMKRQRSGLLVHVSTGLARLPMPCFGLYAASKAALETLAETYRYELSTLGIDSVIVEPGVYPTNLGAAALSPGDTERVLGYGPLAELPAQMMKGLESFFRSANAPDPRDVPNAILRLIRLPAGQRPLRTAVGGSNTALEALNATTDRLQRELMTSQGLAHLLGAGKPAE